MSTRRNKFQKHEYRTQLNIRYMTAILFDKRYFPRSTSHRSLFIIVFRNSWRAIKVTNVIKPIKCSPGVWLHSLQPIRRLNSKSDSRVSNHVRVACILIQYQTSSSITNSQVPVLTHLNRCTITAFKRFASDSFWDSSVSSLFGNVVIRTKFIPAICGLELYVQ